MIASCPSVRWMQKRFACVGERLADLEQEVDGERHGHPSALVEPPGEVAALQVLDDHVRRAALELPHVDHARDVLALDLHGGARLAQEARDRVGAADGLRQQELERHLFVELKVVRGDDDAHPADAEHALDPVLSRDHVAGREVDVRAAVHHPSPSSPPALQRSAACGCDVRFGRVVRMKRPTPIAAS